jgi:hypothetical protein
MLGPISRIDDPMQEKHPKIHHHNNDDEYPKTGFWYIICHEDHKCKIENDKSSEQETIGGRYTGSHSV